MCVPRFKPPLSFSDHSALPADLSFKSTSRLLLEPDRPLSYHGLHDWFRRCLDRHVRSQFPAARLIARILERGWSGRVRLFRHESIHLRF